MENTEEISNSLEIFFRFSLSIRSTLESAPTCATEKVGLSWQKDLWEDLLIASCEDLLSASLMQMADTYRGGLMHALIGFMKKPENVSTEEFRSWWLKNHVPHVLKIPGLRHYVICPADFAFNPKHAEFSKPAGADGVAILYFDDEQAIRNAFLTPSGESDMEHFNQMGLVSVIVMGEAIVQLGSVVLSETLAN